MKTYRVTGGAVVTLILVTILSGCFGPLTDSQQSLQIELRSASGQIAAQGLSDGDDGYLFAMVISEEVLLDGGASAATLLSDTEAALIEAQESIAQGTTPEEFDLNLTLESGEFQSLVVNFADSPSGTALFNGLASGTPYFVVVHVIGPRETLIGTARATLDAGETSTVPITLSNDLTAFENEVSTRYGGTIDLSLEYTVTFDTREGNSIEPVILGRGDDVGEALTIRPDAPVRSPDTFLGWRLGSVSGDAVSANTDTPVVQDVELVASWTATIEVSGLDQALLDIAGISGNTYYDLVDAETYTDPSPSFDGISSSTNFTSWYNQTAVELVDIAGSDVAKSGTRSPLSDPDEDGTYEITGVLPHKQWRLLITTWDTRSNTLSGTNTAALFSSAFTTGDGSVRLLDAQADPADFTSASWYC